MKNEAESKSSDVITIQKSTIYTCGCFALAFIVFLLIVVVGYGFWYMTWGPGVGMFRLA